MNDLSLILYIFTWLLAVAFYALWRNELREHEKTSTRFWQIEQTADNNRKRADYYQSRFEVDEMLLHDPQLKFVGTCEDCKRRENEAGECCKVMLSFESVVKSNYCSQYDGGTHERNIQAATGPEVP